jgi:hypothetical protein
MGNGFTVTQKKCQYEKQENRILYTTLSFEFGHQFKNCILFSIKLINWKELKYVDNYIG